VRRLNPLPVNKSCPRILAAPTRTTVADSKSRELLLLPFPVIAAATPVLRSGRATLQKMANSGSNSPVVAKIFVALIVAGIRSLSVWNMSIMATSRSLSCPCCGLLATHSQSWTAIVPIRLDCSTPSRPKSSSSISIFAMVAISICTCGMLLPATATLDSSRGWTHWINSGLPHLAPYLRHSRSATRTAKNSLTLLLAATMTSSFSVVLSSTAATPLRVSRLMT
jgi:hypothetical protein